MTTAVTGKKICDSCGDEIKDRNFYGTIVDDRHYHIHCMVVMHNV